MCYSLRFEPRPKPAKSTAQHDGYVSFAKACDVRNLAIRQTGGKPHPDHVAVPVPQTPKRKDQLMPSLGIRDRLFRRHVSRGWFGEPVDWNDRPATLSSKVIGDDMSRDSEYPVRHLATVWIKRPESFQRIEERFARQLLGGIRAPDAITNVCEERVKMRFANAPERRDNFRVDCLCGGRACEHPGNVELLQASQNLCLLIRLVGRSTTPSPKKRRCRKPGSALGNP
jgi:hypothetical protein